MVSSANYNLAIGQSIGASIGTSGVIRPSERKQKEDKPKIIAAAKIKFHKIRKNEKYQVQGNFPEDYVITTEVEASSKQLEKNMELMSRYRLITFKLPQKQMLTYLKDCYMIDYLVSPERYEGAGTKAVQGLLDRSMSEKDTEGRIVVMAKIIDGKTSPAGFFYKLGFRFVDNEFNDIMDKWMIKKLEVEAPQITGMMYLPKQHINKLMMYNRNFL